MYRKILSLLLAALLFLSSAPAAAEEYDPDDSDPTDNIKGSFGDYNIERFDIPQNPPDTAFDYTFASAANAALLLRFGAGSEPYNYWVTSLGHAPQIYKIKKATISMLQNAVGSGVAPVGIGGIRYRSCAEVPLPLPDEELQQGLDFNLHGSIYSDSPLLSVSASFEAKSGKSRESATVTFLPESDVRAYSLVSDAGTVEGKALDDILDIRSLPAGRYQLTVSATSAANPSGTTLVSQEVRISKVEAHLLTRNKFDDNYIRASRFFEGNTEEFLFHYWARDDRNISTENAWREKYLEGESSQSALGRVHTRAVPYFNKAAEYMENTYFCVTLETTRSNGEVRITHGKPRKLKELLYEDRAYVPRFQSNLQYVSHHTLGTATDVNDTMYPNHNVLSNHELIGNDVRYALTYNGILTDKNGQQYYDFTYTGSYKAKYKGVPTTIVNYLLYELAFYRAGFQWGFYYETACDGMHFMLSEKDINRHMDSDVGLRKVYEYID